LIAFARTGNPNNPAIPDWPARDGVDRTAMPFDLTCKAMDDPHRDVRKALKSQRKGQLAGSAPEGR
jgi:para-nitrobenzyl esterase